MKWRKVILAVGLLVVCPADAAEKAITDGKYVRMPKGEAKNLVIGTLRSPKYPYLARKQRLEAAVRLRVYVGPDGRIDEVKIQKLVGDRTLAEYALRNAKDTYKFRPPVFKGKPTAVFIDIPLVFRLDAPEGVLARLGVPFPPMTGWNVNAFIDRYGK